IASQAPGIRAHESGRPFDDPSGVRLRQWLGMNEEEFYDPSMVAIVPMRFCFPGLSPSGGDLPPRRECVEVWRRKLFARLPTLALLLVVGGYAHRWHFGSTVDGKGVNETVRARRQIYRADPSLRRLPLPHPAKRRGSVYRTVFNGCTATTVAQASIDQVRKSFVDRYTLADTATMPQDFVGGPSLPRASGMARGDR
ncbi:hypothetical protein EOD07_35385, partial [Mesorhizobium sp. M2C.T.Ca.TU.002.02.1.1]